MTLFGKFWIGLASATLAAVGTGLAVVGLQRWEERRRIRRRDARADELERRAEERERQARRASRI